MKKILTLASVAGLCLIAQAAVADTPVLTVYTYDSFAADWGPGPQIKSGFEETCGCTVKFVTAGDGAALLSRLELEGAAGRADVAVGLDTSLIARARETGLFATSGVGESYDMPVAWDDPVFVPFDWGYFAFVANKGAPEVHSFKELAASNIKIVIEDPRSSTPGLGLLLWVKKAYGDGAAKIWADLADNIVTVTPGWDQAYGLFLNGEADAVLSYSTSPAYHLIAENDPSKVAWTFDEGQYMQIEVAARMAASKQPDLAQKFLAYLVSDKAQAVIPTTNWMYPVVMPKEGLPKGFEMPVAPDKALLMSPDEAAAARDGALEEWRTALSR
ncbi:MAG: thiamine ABC transporter substrate binding subunit [Limimaricola sp.]|uniref:thiamine ABC transporter substrate binding subunit n=1 Tax=Limimaricola sp. TaxID=2211665 RepID=UPI001D6F0F1C|nr:thiamine ABC transporter substrate binding subunit [Limimaricola sp.]MBI1417090.1 thiamine ABC transporter substrate binding subunit [Limimaricola sp.]